jgi:ABC-type transporter lipoprotein component MlaA
MKAGFVPASGSWYMAALLTVNRATIRSGGRRLYLNISRSLAAWFVAGSLLTTWAADRDSKRDEDSALVSATENAIVLPEPIGDPVEPFNRAMWALNQGLLKGAIQPSGKAYRAVVPEEVRRGIRNAGRNLEYPRNVVNNLLQQRWTGARDETYRFLLNSVAGIGGLFDVATESGIPGAAADFGQTLRDWQWRPRIYLMLPILGPSNERDALGSFVDWLINPISYFSPYSYIPAGVTYNNLTDTVDEYIRVAKSDFDPYYVLRYAWILKREARPVDLELEGEQDRASLETLQTVFFARREARFPELGEKRQVKIAGTGKELPYTLWLQEGNAPVVFLLPGIGSHRLSGGALALSELLFDAGFSVLTVSSTFNYEFMERAATTDLPGYAPVDTRDLHLAMTEIDRDIRAKYPERIGRGALAGYSMGGFHSLYLAGLEATNDTGLVKFDRYVAIDTPVRLDRAISTLDDHFRAALEWPAATRTAKIEDTFAKVAALVNGRRALTPESPIPLNAIESKFLIGLAFRLTLRDVIFISQTKTNLGVIQEPLNPWSREQVYREILQYSFNDYLEKFAAPYYRARGIDLNDPSVFEKAVDLRRLAGGLKDNPKVRAIINANDPLLSEDGLAWLKSTFGSGQLTVFEGGGHLGNLNQTVVQREIVRALAGLGPARDAY